jgi:rRNA maturation endonuclease Nob1
MSDRQRAIFEAALNRTRCPKCRGKVLETMMPDAVCEKCGTQYILATRMGQGLLGGGLHAQLIEKNPSPQMAMQYAPAPQIAMQQPVMQQQAASGRFCHNCGSSTDVNAKFCIKCGTQV